MIKGIVGFKGYTQDYRDEVKKRFDLNEGDEVDLESYLSSDGGLELGKLPCYIQLIKFVS